MELAGLGSRFELTYATVYGMKRTTVYLPEELKAELERVAAADMVAEAELIREGVRRVVEERGQRRPQVPLFESGDATLAERVDELLRGFGER